MITRTRIVAVIVVLSVVAGGVWFFATRGRESTDDAQVDAHVTPIAARVGGTVRRVPVRGQNQPVFAAAITSGSSNAR